MIRHGYLLLARVFRFLLERFLPASQKEALLGDLDEEYVSNQNKRGSHHANAAYCREAIVALAFAGVQGVRRALRPGREIMSDEPSRTVVARVAMNVVAFISFWFVSLGLIQFAERVLHGWPSSELMQLAACALGVVIALRLRARFVALLLAGMLAFTAAELLMHSIVGIRAVQGGPTHLAVMIAGTAGVMLGVFLAPYVRGNGPGRPVLQLASDDAAPASSRQRVVLTA